MTDGAANLFVAVLSTQVVRAFLSQSLICGDNTLGRVFHF